MKSIIIPVYNNHDQTDECIRAVLDTTNDCELIVIDNGSSPEYKPPFSGFVPVTVIRNLENKGFPAAVNQGIEAAAGDVIILLNNDVIVTPGALERLAGCLDEFSIISPMTNYCAGIQQITLPVYNNIEELNKEAEYLAQENVGTEEVNFVIGFCMAFKKSLYDELGKFDESLWPCSGEEIDFCLRARQAGYKVGITKDVYVHHYGSQTFANMQEAGQINYQEVVKKCDAHLAEKWGADFWQRQTISSPHNKSVGAHSYGTENITVFFGDEANLTIGDYCSIGPDVKIYCGGEHRCEWISTYPFSHFYPEIEANYRVSKGDVTIGNDVWIGHGAMILSGVTIGDGAVIGAGAVVASDVEPYSIVAGNPAKKIRSRFNPSDIDLLLNIKWWDWPEDKIYNAINILQSGDVAALVEYATRKAAA